MHSDMFQINNTNVNIDAHPINEILTTYLNTCFQIMFFGECVMYIIYHTCDRDP